MYRLYRESSTVRTTACLRDHTYYRSATQFSTSVQNTPRFSFSCSVSLYAPRNSSRMYSLAVLVRVLLIGSLIRCTPPWLNIASGDGRLYAFMIRSSCESTVRSVSRVMAITHAASLHVLTVQDSHGIDSFGISKVCRVQSIHAQVGKNLAVRCFVAQSHIANCRRHVCSSMCIQVNIGLRNRCFEVILP